MIVTTCNRRWRKNKRWDDRHDPRLEVPGVGKTDDLLHRFVSSDLLSVSLSSPIHKEDEGGIGRWKEMVSGVEDNTTGGDVTTKETQVHWRERRM